MSAELLALLDGLDAAREKATPGEWAQHPADTDYVVADVADDGESYTDVADTYAFRKGAGSVDAALIVAAVNSLPKLTAALRNVLTGLDHLDRMRPTFSSIEARMAYADTIDHVRACIAAALTPEQADR